LVSLKLVDEVRCKQNNLRYEAAIRTSKTAAGALLCLDGISKRRQSVEMPPWNAITLLA
jgi:hypothetical protein